MGTCLHINNLTIRYDKRKTDGVSNLSLSVNKGEILSLIGPSGSGKTTSLKCIAGKLEAESGTIDFHETMKIGYVDQEAQLDDSLTVFENLDNELKPSIQEADRRANQIRTTLAQLEITNEINSITGSISGGQKQRVIIAKALVNNPTLLLLDEPFANLDKLLRTQILEELFELFKAQEITTIWVTHNTEEALAYSDQIALLNFGKLQQYGTPKELYNRPKNLFSAQFFSQVNLISGKLINSSQDEISVSILNREFILKKPKGFISKEHGDILAVIHPEHIIYEEGSSLKGEITNSIFKGSRTILEVSYGEYSFFVEVSSNSHFNLNDTFPFQFDIENIHCLSEV